MMTPSQKAELENGAKLDAIFERLKELSDMSEEKASIDRCIEIVDRLIENQNGATE